MPKYIVRICRSELVLLGADVEVVARTAESARASVRKRVADGEEFEELWFESDSAYTEEPIEITGVWRERNK
jgi:hypothetical protein